LRRALSIASGNQYFGIGKIPMHATHGGPRILICCGGHSTGVEHNQISLARRRGWDQSLLPELAFQNGTVGLRSATSEAVQKKFSHQEYYRHVGMRSRAANSSQPVRLFHASLDNAALLTEYHRSVLNETPYSSC
jgi:hypothetical protein